MKIQGKTFVVTGAGGGIGSQIVSALIARGAAVAAVDLQAASLQHLQDSLGEAGKQVSVHPLDITDRAAVDKLPDAVVRAHGTVDALVNCAGIIQPFIKIADLDYQTIERVMGVNFYGTLYMTKAFLPHLLERPEAYVANVASMGGFLPVPGQGVYGASKAAVKLLTEALYAELLDTPVHVSIVFPGATNTNISQNSGVEAPTVPSTGGAYTMLSPAAAADSIVRGIERNKPRIFTGQDAQLMDKLYRLNPVYATRFITKKMQGLLKK